MRLFGSTSCKFVRQILLLTNIFVSSPLLWSQEQHSGTPLSFTKMLSPVTQTLSYTFDEPIDSNLVDSTYRVGLPEHVNIDFFQLAQHEITSDGISIYRLRFEIPDILGIGFDFSSFQLPEGDSFFAYSTDRNVILGAFTSSNNQSDGKFSIQPIPSSTVLLEYNETATGTTIPSIMINRIKKIYKPFFEMSPNTFNRSLDCMVQVHCEENIEVERSVVRWMYYDLAEQVYKVCSGVLITQDVPSNQLKPYIITANHCGQNAELSTAIFYFNYQPPFCGSSFFYNINHTLVGSTQKASRSNYDMFLLELYTFPPPDYNVHLAGYNRSSWSNLTDFIMGIHHPQGTEKRISLGTLQANTNANLWRVS
ncbi:MAG: hypothetical protein M3R08_01240, partial [Bacteroidota bacterium]|nr:hypothetical protein [Bacteroidota bacterium]